MEKAFLDEWLIIVIEEEVYCPLSTWLSFARVWPLRALYGVSLQSAKSELTGQKRIGVRVAEIQRLVNSWYPKYFQQPNTG